MNIKIDNNTELMFAHAVGLSQSGKMKNTIHCGRDSIFILNMDNTILLKYSSRQSFTQSFSFFANDYESPHMRIDEEGHVVFVSVSKGVSRTKVCPAPKTSFEDVEKIWNGFSPDRGACFDVSKDMVNLLDDGLSHVELSKLSGEGVKLTQKDIYTGSRIEVTPSKLSKGFSFDDGVPSSFYFGPIGVRTTDMQSLFIFSESLQCYPQKDRNWMFIQDNSIKLEVILATCLYDELGYIKED